MAHRGTRCYFKKTGIKGEEYKRLKIGFNYEHLKEIPHRDAEIYGEFDDSGISLALDFLVDSGVIIPIFYYRSEDGYYERDYQYGEDALSAKQYGYLIALVTKDLFDFIKKQGGKNTIPKIVYERIGVIIQEEIERTGVVDILKKPLDSSDRNLFVAPAFGRRGKINHISDEAYEKSNHYPYMFTQWCQKENIIQYGKDNENVL